ncbi:histone-like nucleoid-structuring protein Lsr2 [Actinacidiphila glaucinigra]|uniref:histone-like nucleoid-structuring protein Lsr2 n=1 Tax=Actinacidiphila glaucinigra TaxID=235986 RepID=UPI00366A8CEB
MAQEVRVRLVDDMDGGEAEETVCFAIDGRAYEIDLSGPHAAELRAAIEPYRTRARRAGINSLQAKGVTRLPIGQHLSTVPAARHDDSSEIRDWAKSWGLPVNERGRISHPMRQAHTAYTRGDTRPLDALLEKHGIDKDAAEAAMRAAADAKTISAEPATPPVMTADERNAQSARQAGRLSDAQLSRLRQVYAEPDGEASSDGTPADNTSWRALERRGLVTRIATQRYRITPVGRVWFEVHGVEPPS